MPLITFTLFALALNPPAPAQTKVTDEEVARVHRSALLIDTHNDVTSQTVRGFDIGLRSQSGHTDLPRLKEGGVGAVFFAAYVSSDYAKKGQAARRALEMTDTILHDIVARYPNDFVLATSADQIEAAHRKGKVAALIGVEGGHAIENSLRVLRGLYALGARYMTLTHANSNDWADSSGDIADPGMPHHNGLTAFGRDVVREMNRIGMIVDVSHVSDKTFQDVLETSSAPVFASHSSCRALSSIARNMTDGMIRALAKKGGVVQINFGCEFLSQQSADASPWTGRAAARVKAAPPGQREKLDRELTSKMPRATLADVVAHIDHVVKIAGIDAVGIGSDFSGVGCTPAGLDDNSKYPALTRALLERGYTGAQIRKIYGENTLRLMRAVERAAAR